MGWSRQVNPSSASAVVNAVDSLLAPASRSEEPMFGDGHAAEYVVRDLLEFLR
jgi:hypothetical protein